MHGKNYLNSSKGEIKYCAYLMDKYKDFDCYTMYTHPVPRKFGTIVPDFYAENSDQTVKIAGFFMGCISHGHLLDECPITPPNSSKWTTNYYKKTFGELNERFKQQKEVLTEKYGITAFEVIYECQLEAIEQGNFRQLADHNVRRECESIRSFLTNNFIPRPTERLEPREALRGGKTEVYNLYFKPEENPGYKLFYLDACSLYPTIAMIEPYASQFPTGRYSILIGDSIKAVFYDECLKKWRINFGAKKVDVNGLVQVQVYPPKSENLPFLGIKYKLRTYYALCYKCVITNRKSDCNHSDEERSWTSVYVSTEINYASQLGYKFKFFEIYQYPSTAAIFKKTTKVLSSYKIRHSGFPEYVKTLDEKLNYCDKINKKNNYTEPALILTPDNVVRQEDKRQFYKDACNKMLGKFGQSEKVRTKFTNHYLDVEDIFWDPLLKLKEVFTIGKTGIVQVTYERKADFLPMSTKSNVTTASTVTALAREFMDRCFRKLIAVGGKVKYTDTDSCIVALPINAQIPLEIGENFGEFKHELPEEANIVSFVCTGPKSYSIVYEHKGKIYKEVKVKGLFLKGKIAQECLDAEILENSLLKALNSEPEKIRVRQFNITINKKLKQLSSVIGEKKISNDNFSKRTISMDMSDNVYDTRPFGYQSDN